MGAMRNGIRGYATAMNSRELSLVGLDTVFDGRKQGRITEEENTDDNEDTRDSTEQHGGGSTETSLSPGLVSLLCA